MPMLPLLFFAIQAAASDSSSLYRGLERGPHAVGYRAIAMMDRGRHDSLGGAPAQPRQLPVHVWYPAARPATRTLGFADLTGGSLPAFAAHAVELGGARDVVDAGIARLGAIRTWSHRAAPSRAGRHPLVMVPSYLAPGTVSVMAEVLASHGFVVATVEHRGTDARSPEFTLRNIETQSNDLQFALNELARLDFVDDTRVAVMGTGINASAALAFAMRSARVRALVSLEGGITTPFELRMIRGSPYFDARRVRVPILAITAPHPDVDAARLDVYRYAPQHRVHLPGTGEFWLLNFGPLHAVLPGIIGTPRGDVHTAFVTATRYVERFLSAYLRSDDEARRFLSTPPATLGVPSGVATIETRPARAPVITRDTVMSLLVAGGAAALERRVREELPRDPEAVTIAEFMAADAWLASRGDSMVAGRVLLGRLRADMAPASARAHFSLARLHLANRDTAAAAESSRRAADLLAADGDRDLDAIARSQVLDLARQLGVRR